ncbi:hypothetical protein QBC47DRAFT_382659 [Echria macrotheca]|uniref:Uncharacterized protein n=1 Tax=Echria macrotheca TaxID=438768 RepID=A0AAJ0F4X2_9PEZI|nr:hypothetical protein QBC47DRAFT_382659 [Echria macrotheca]
MDSDDLMPDMQSGILQQLDPQTQAALNAMAQGTSSSSTGPGAWNTKKFRDEFQAARIRLTDQKFNPNEYADPLLPRTGDLKRYPPGTTTEMEVFLKDLIARVKKGEA